MHRRVKVMTSVKLRVQLKFPEQIKKTKANGYPTIPVEVSSACDLWTIDGIRQQICANESFNSELRARGIEASCIDVQNSHFLCRGVVLSNDNLNTGSLLPPQTLDSGAHAALANVVWKISVKTPVRADSPPPPQQFIGSCDSDLDSFCKFLKSTNAQLVHDFFAGNTVADNISETRLFKIASRQEPLIFKTLASEAGVDSVDHCIKLLSELNNFHELYVARRKALNKEELGIQKYALDNGKVQRLNLHRTHPKLFDAYDGLPPAAVHVSTPLDPAHLAAAPPSPTTALFTAPLAALPLSAHSSPAPLAQAGAGCALTEDMSSVSKANRRLAWTYSERLHHKLHDMLMFDVAELELDGKKYKGKGDVENGPQNPKRDLQNAENVQVKKLSACKTSLAQMLSESQEYGSLKSFSLFPSALQNALDVVELLQHEASAAQPNSTADCDRWFSKENAWYSLEDIMHYWRNSTSEKKIMPHPRSVLSKKVFEATKKATISLDTTASLVLQEFASELNGKLLTEFLMTVDSNPDKDVNEHEVFDLVRNLRKGNKTVEKHDASTSPIFALFKPAFAAAGPGGEQASQTRTIKLKQAGEIVLKEFASEVNGQELVALLKNVVTDRIEFERLKIQVASCSSSDDSVDESRFLHFVNTNLKAFVSRQLGSTKKSSKDASPNIFKEAFAAALKKGSSSVSLNQVVGTVELAFSSEVNEVKFLELVKQLQAQIGVRDVVDFYDKLVKIEDDRKAMQKPPKLEFRINPKDQRFIDMYRILDTIQHQTIHDENIRDLAGNLCEHRLMFAGQILVRCASMQADPEFRDSYLASIQEINRLQRTNEERLEKVSASLNVLRSFLFILARARIHASLKMFDPEIEATSSLGLAGIKQFQHFMSNAIFEAEGAAYRDLGVRLDSPDAMRANPDYMMQKYGVTTKKEDLYQVRARFRELCFISLKEIKLPSDLDCAKFMREPFRRLKKLQAPVLKPIDIANSTKSDTFTVATVTTLLITHCCVCVHVFCLVSAHASAVQCVVPQNGLEAALRLSQQTSQSSPLPETTTRHIVAAHLRTHQAVQLMGIKTA